MLLYVMDAHFNIGLLEGLISSAKGTVDLRLDPLCLVDQPHQLPDQDIPLFIHKAVAHVSQPQGVLCCDQVSLGGECIWIHLYHSFALSDGL